MPKSGNIAFISQSGALGSAILDWAIQENIGFSNFVSVGSILDVDFGDLIDYFGADPQTRSILMYIEGLTDARKFLSAARHFARTKPIIVVKAGKYSLTGEDVVYDAAFKRAGIVRVEEIAGYQSKTILTSFMGSGAVEEANRIFNQNSIPTYSTPEQAVKTYLYMYQYTRNLELLYETPEELLVDAAPPKRPIMVVMRNAALENRELLNEVEAKKLLEYYDFPVVKTAVAKMPDEAAAIAMQIGYPVVLGFP